MTRYLMLMFADPVQNELKLFQRTYYEHEMEHKIFLELPLDHTTF